MNILKLAREVWSAGDVYIGPPEDQLERFTALIHAAALEEAAEYFQDGWASPDCYEIADAIRALKDKP